VPAEVCWLPLADVAPGTPLAGDLADDSGNVLLTAGTRLAPTLLASLARHGISVVPVAAGEASAGSESPDDRAARAAELRAALEKRFAGTGSNPASQALFETVLAHRLEQRKV
jgi:hypothetical protein